MVHRADCAYVCRLLPRLVSPWNTNSCPGAFQQIRVLLLLLTLHRISLYRLQNAVFELRIHLHLSHVSHTAYLATANIELTHHGDCLLVSGNLPPYVRGDYYGHGHEHVSWDKVVSQGTIVWTDQPCGRFGRSVPIGLRPGTEVCSLVLTAAMLD
jgi:hypothetical protein